MNNRVSVRSRASRIGCFHPGIHRTSAATHDDRRIRPRAGEYQRLRPRATGLETPWPDAPLSEGSRHAFTTETEARNSSIPGVSSICLASLGLTQSECQDETWRGCQL